MIKSKKPYTYVEDKNDIQIYDVTSKEVERMQTMVRNDILNTGFLFIDQLKFHNTNQAEKTEKQNFWQLAFSRTVHQSKTKKFPTSSGLEN